MPRSTLLAAIAITLVATPALARDWAYVTTNGRGVSVAAATASFERRGDRLSGLFRFRDRDGYSYKHVVIDCRNMTIGEAVAAGPTDRLVPQGLGHHAIVPGSLGASMASTMCDTGRSYDGLSQPAGPETYMPPPVQFSNPASGR